MTLVRYLKPEVWWKRMTAVAATIFIVGCTAMPLAYNNADLLVRLRGHQYFDLQGQQEKDFNARVAYFHRWHRTEELPRYELLFRTAGQRIGHGLAREDVSWAIGAVRERYRILMRKVSVEVAPVLSTLTPDQIAQTEKRFADDNIKFAKEQHLNDSEEKRLKARTKWARKQFEDWLGSLTPEQEARIDEMIKNSPSLAGYRLEERKLNQQRFLLLMRKHLPPNELAIELQKFFEGIEANRSPPFAHAVEQTENQFTQLLLDIDKTLSASQRSYAVRRFAGFAGDFEKLASASQKSSGSGGLLHSLVEF